MPCFSFGPLGVSKNNETHCQDRIFSSVKDYTQEDMHTILPSHCLSIDGLCGKDLEV